MIHPLRLVNIPAPVPATDFVYTQPAGIASRIRNLRFQVSDDANAGTRLAVASLFDPGGLRMTSAAFPGALLDGGDEMTFILIDESARPQGTRAIVGSDDFYWRGSSLGILLPGWQLRSEVQGMFAGDRILSIYVIFEDLNLLAAGAVA